MQVAAVNIQAGRINRSRFKKRLEGCKFVHMTGVRCVLPGMMYVAKVRGGGPPNASFDPLITPLHIPHREPGSGERVTDKEGRDDDEKL
jgi:hypothetical protein